MKAGARAALAWLPRVLTIVLLFAWSPAFAQEKPADPAKPAAAAETAQRPQAHVTRQHVMRLGERTLSYKSTAGFLNLHADGGEKTAEVFFTAYQVEGAGPRPITFAFNGGPGAASAFLHLGAMGPRMVPFLDDGSAAVQPVGLADNPDTWLEFTDLVFVDPPSTGYSRPVGGDQAAAEKFYGVEKDADAMAQFIRNYLTSTDRGLGAVFLAGESYGGFRVALLAKRLLRGGIDVRGTILVSPVLEFSLIWGDQWTLMPSVLALPSIAAAHAESNGVLDNRAHEDAERFARGPYLLHLAKGRVDDPQVTDVLARLTGLPREAIAERHGRIGVRDYARHRREEAKRAISLYDGAVGTPTPLPPGERSADPILDYAVKVLEPAFVSYARTELGFSSDLQYRLLSGEVRGKWDFGSTPQRQGFAGAADELQEARTQRPALRVFIAAGLTDLVTPYATSRFLIDQLPPIPGASPITMNVYRGGHMMYLRPHSRKALAADARTLYGDAMK